MFTHLLDFILIATPKTVFKTNIKIKLKVTSFTFQENQSWSLNLEFL